jgi:hypothetical protein
MIFTRTCDNTRKIALSLRNLGFGAIPIHGQMSQPKRLGALNKFKVKDMSGTARHHVSVERSGTGGTAVCDGMSGQLRVWMLCWKMIKASVQT